jgi:hypothetical protein
MKFRKIKWLVVYMALAIVLSSCNLGATPVPTMDVGVIQTQAFAQVMTQAAAAFTPTAMPTNTPEPTTTLSAPPTFAPIGGGSGTVTPFAFNTPLPGLTPIALSPIPTLPGSVPTITTENGCNNGAFIGESAPYDGTVMQPGVEFEKNFDIMNTGSCTWDEGYTFVFQPGYSTEGFRGYDIKFRKVEDFTKPGEIITFSLKLKVEVQPGEHQGAWKLRDDGGNYFGPLVFVNYVVGTRPQREATAEADSLTATAEAK